MNELTYKLELFEGPLDLLLSLISKNKLDILKIRISDLVDQYIEQIDKMKLNNMEISSEFLEIAAKLIYIKSNSLLPKYEDTENLEDELKGQLLEYQECKRIAQILSEKICYDTFVRGPSKIDFDMAYKKTHSLDIIFNAYLSTLGKNKKVLVPDTEHFSKLVKKRIVSVYSKIIYVLKSLWGKGYVYYKDLFKSYNKKTELVATFLAILELVKVNNIAIDNEGKDLKLTLVKRGGKACSLKK